MTLRIGWFSTGAGPGSQRQRLLSAVIKDIHEGTLDADISFAFCNRERGENEGTDSYLDLVDGLDIPLIAFSSRDFRRARGGALSKPGEPLPSWRRQYDREVAKLIEQYPFDVGVLAGYMLIFTGEMCNRYPLLNLHPAAPGGPAGTWQDVIWQLIEQRASESGAMIHLSTEELDAGPVVAHCTFSLRDAQFEDLWDAMGERSPEDIRQQDDEQDLLFQEIRRRGAACEEPLVRATLHALADGRVRVEGNLVIDGHGQPLPRGLDLSSEVNRQATGAQRLQI